MPVSESESDKGPLDTVFGAGDAERAVWAPYRISPLGAHTDHQDGLTCGFTIDRGVSLRWRPSTGPWVRLLSEDRPGEARCDLDGAPEGEAQPEWAAYPTGIVRVLAARGLVRTGIEGVVRGALPPGGISTSAALQVAILNALLEANETSLPPMEATQIVREAERASTGVQVGLLDPAVILHGRADALVFVDCRQQVARLHRWARRTPPTTWFLIDSGVARDLRRTPYNERVAECRDVARRSSGGNADVLRDVTPEAYRRQRKQLDTALMKRAEHYYSEVKRVKLGVQAVARGDTVGFGRLIRASAESLTNNFDCGVPETRRLLEILNATEGVLGASYAGGGWGGLVQVFAEPGAGDRMRAAVETYLDAFPEARSGARVWEVGLGAAAHGG